MPNNDEYSYSLLLYKVVLTVSTVISFEKSDNLEDIVVTSVINASQSQAHPFNLNDRDVICITESIVARAQGNYISTEIVAERFFVSPTAIEIEF